MTPSQPTPPIPTPPERVPLYTVHTDSKTGEVLDVTPPAPPQGSETPGAKVWLVWSHEHDAWWRENGNGYTLDFTKAGRFTEADADKACRARSNRGGKPMEEKRSISEMPEIAALQSDLTAARLALEEARRERDGLKEPCTAQEEGSRIYCQCHTCRSFQALQRHLSDLTTQRDAALADAERLREAKDIAVAYIESLSRSIFSDGCGHQLRTEALGYLTRITAALNPAEPKL